MRNVTTQHNNIWSLNPLTKSSTCCLFHVYNLPKQTLCAITYNMRNLKPQHIYVQGTFIDRFHLESPINAISPCYYHVKLVCSIHMGQDISEFNILKHLCVNIKYYRYIPFGLRYKYNIDHKRCNNMKR